MNTTMVLMFAVHPSTNATVAVDDSDKFVVRLEVPVDVLPKTPSVYTAWIASVTDSIRQLFDPSGACVYLMSENEPSDLSKLSMRFTFEQLRSDLVDMNMKLSRLEPAVYKVIGTWDSGGNLAAAVNDLRTAAYGDK